MGNQEIKSVMAKVTTENFAKGQQIRDAFQNNAYSAITDNDILTQLFSNLEETGLDKSNERYLSEKMQKCFPFHNRIAFDLQMSDEDRWDHNARELWQMGYTTWQHNISELRGDDSQQLAMSQNKSTVEFEFQFYSKCLMVCANFLLRFQGVTEVKDLITFTQETFEDENREYSFESTMNSVFFTLLNSLTDSLAGNPEAVLAVVNALLKSTANIEAGALSQQTKEGLARDLVVKRVRDFLIPFIENSNTSVELKTKCVELLLSLGLVTGNAENLILAAQFQFEFKIDISKYLKSFFGSSDEFIPSEIDDSGQITIKWDATEKTRLQNRCEFKNKVDRQGQSDKTTCNGSHYFNWRQLNGLNKTKVKANGEWSNDLAEQVSSHEDSVKVEGFTFLVHKEFLFGRNKDTADAPFILIDQATMNFDAVAPPITFGDEETKQRFKNTHAETNPPKEASDGHKRWQHVCPMASDGRYIYTLVQYYATTIDHTERKSMYCEKYQLEEKVLTYVGEQKLYEEDGTTSWIGHKKSNDDAAGGYLNHGTFVHNGDTLIWLSRKNYHVFDWKTGKRERRVKNYFSAAHITCFNPVKSKFYGQDAAVYSWLDEFEITGYQTRIQVDAEEDVKHGLPLIEYNLNEQKTKIKDNLEFINEPNYRSNILAKFIGGELEKKTHEKSKTNYDNQLKIAKEKAVEERAKADVKEGIKDLPEENWLQNWSRAIIYAKVSKNAQESNHTARNLLKQLNGEQMLKYVKKKDGISLSESMFKSMRLCLLELLKDYDMKKCDISVQHALKNLLHIYIGHIGSLRPLQFQIKDILSTEEMIEQKKLVEKLQNLDFFPQQKQYPDEAEVERVKASKSQAEWERWLFQLHIVHLAKQIIEEMNVAVSTESVIQRLSNLTQKFEEQKDKSTIDNDTQEEIDKSLRQYHTAQLTGLFDQGPDEIQQLQDMIKKGTEFMKNRLKNRIDQIFLKQELNDDKWQGYGSKDIYRISEFLFNFLQELMITYALQNKIIQDNQLPDKRDDYTEEQKKKEDLIRRKFKDAEDKIARLTSIFFETMITWGHTTKETLKYMGNKFYTLNLSTDWTEDEKKLLFKHSEFIVFGKFSQLRSMVQFTMQIQLINLQYTELDEVHLSLEPVIEGLNFFNAATETQLSQKPDLEEPLQRILEQSQFFLRHISFGESKTASRLVNCVDTEQEKQFQKFKILSLGIVEDYIPSLSENCRKEIEGSFKIVKDERLKSLSQQVTAVELTEDDMWLKNFMSDAGSAKLTHKNLLNAIKEHRADLSQTETERTGIVSDEEDEAELRDLLVHQSFGIMIRNQGKVKNLRTACNFIDSNQWEQAKDELKPLVSAWKAANSRIKQWVKMTGQKIEEKIRVEVTEEFMKKLVEDNPDGNMAGKKLTDPQNTEIDKLCSIKTALERDTAIKNASKKLDFLRLIENNKQEAEIDQLDVQPERWLQEWDTQDSDLSYIEPNSARSTSSAEASGQLGGEAQTEIEKNKMIQDDVIGILENDLKPQQLKDYVEGKMIKGLRRLAGFQMFNKIFSSSTGDAFYDGLHLFNASLRDNKVKLTHYLSRVTGCGYKIEQKLREQFRETIKLISLRLEVEKDPKRIVLLCDSLLWNYNSTDMQFLAECGTIRILSGCDAELGIHGYHLSQEDLYNPLRAAWGREQNYYSLENLEVNVNTMNSRSYNLAARLQQTFDFLVHKTYKIAFTNKQYQIDSKLQKVIKNLMQQIHIVIFQKIDQYLYTLTQNEMSAASERDEYIRFDNVRMEKDHNNDVLMADQLAGSPNQTADEALKSLALNQKSQLQLIEKFVMKIYTDDNFGIPQEVRKILSEVYDGNDAMIKEAIKIREWRAIEYLKTIPPFVFKRALDLPVDAAVETIVSKPKNEDDAEKIAEIDVKLNDKEKINGYLVYMRKREGIKAGITQTTCFSRVTIMRLLRHVVQMMSLAEMNSDTAKIPFSAMKPKNLSSLVRLSVHGAASTQSIIQKVFQSMIRINFRSHILDNSVIQAKNDDDKITKILAITPLVKMQSDFWQLLFNQIHMAKQAQFSPAYQIELGKPVVVQEITRTFLTYSTLKQVNGQAGELRRTIQQAIEKKLENVDELNEAEISTIFQLVPEASIPVLCMGKRAQDDKGEQFIVLGFKDGSVKRKYLTSLSMIPLKATKLQGLVLKDGKQDQRSYDLRHVTAVADIGEDTLTQGKRKQLAKTIATQQNFMKPEVLKKLISVMTQKESILRNNPEKANAHRYLQLYVQNGIKTILTYYKEHYMTVIKSFGMLEILITYLSQTAAVQTIQSDEPLVGTNLLSVQASEVQMAAHHTSLSTGFYTSLQIFVEDTNEQAAFLLRLTEDKNFSEFMDFKIKASYNGEGSNKSKCINSSEFHTLVNMYNQIEDQSEINCGKCEEQFNSRSKISQKKTGYMKCPECSDNCYFCNKCYPKMQTNNKSGLLIDLHSDNLFRISRHEAVLIESSELNTMSIRTLAALRMSNMVVIDSNSNFSLLEFVKRLNEKISEDITWMECSQVQFIQVERAVFDKMKDFINGQKMADLGERGQLLTKIYKKVEFAQKKIDSDGNLAFISKFLKGYSTIPYQDFKNSSVKEILEEEIKEEFKGDLGQLTTDKEIMDQQLLRIDDNSGNILVNEQNKIRKDVVSMRKSEQVPDFMSKFVSSTKSKLIADGSKIFSTEQSSSSSSDFQIQFDNLVFNFIDENPQETHRQQLNSFINKSNQLGARSIWLYLLSKINLTDPETRDSIKITGKHQKICDLIHDSNMAASHQLLFFGNPLPQEAIHKQIIEVLKYFEDINLDEGYKFRDYFYQNFLERADITIERVSAGHYQDLQNMNLKDLRKLTKYDRVLDPSNLIFLAKQMFERKNYLTDQQRAQMAKVMFDLHLGFAILFRADQDVSISLQLIKGSSWALDQIIENMSYFLMDPEQVKNFFKATMLTKMFEYMEVQDIETDKTRRMSEVLIKLEKIYAQTEIAEGGELPYSRPFKMTTKVNNMITGYQALVDGKKFTSNTANIKLVELMNSSQSAEVIKFGRSYKTDNKMWKIYFQRTAIAEDDIKITIDSINSNKMIGIKNLKLKQGINIDQKGLLNGTQNSYHIPAGTKYEITFPIIPTEIFMSGKITIKNAASDNIDKEEYSLLTQVTNNASVVRARHHHAMFINTMGDVMGVGYRASGKGEGNLLHKFRTIERPQNCSDYQVYATGKFQRYLLTKEGKLFFSGQNKNKCAGTVLELNQACEKFTEITNIFSLNQNDKIIDVDGGKHLTVICTANGECYVAGNRMNKAIAEELKFGEEGEDAPYRIKMEGQAEGYKAIRVWGCDLYTNIWVLGEKDDDPLQRKTFCLGADYDMVGGQDSTGAPNWRSPMIPEGVWFEKISSAGMYALGIDNNGDLWEWGGHRQQNEGEVKFWESEKTSNSTAYKLKWFNDNCKKVKEIRCGKAWGMILCQNAELQYELYALGSNDNHRYGKDSEVKAEYGENLKLIKTFSHIDNEIVDFSASFQASFVITKKSQLIKSILENQPDNRDLVHFWKNGNDWEVWDQQKSKDQLDRLPPVCFATRHPIKNFVESRKSLPILPTNPNRNQLFDGQYEDSSSGLKRNGEDFNTVMYYANMKVGQVNRTTFATEEEAKLGGQQHDMNPLIFYRVKVETVDPLSLPAIETSKYFDQSETEEELDMINFSITKAHYDVQQVQKIRINLENQKIQEMLTKLKNFQPELDLELLRAIDLYKNLYLSEIDVKKLLATHFDIKKIPLSSMGKARKQEEQILVHRISLLVILSRNTAILLPSTFFEPVAADQTSIQSLMKQHRDLLLPSVKIGIYRERCAQFFATRNTEEQVKIVIDRTLGDDFWKLGMKNNPDFITDSIFGQMFKQLSLRDTEFTCMQNNNSPFKAEIVKAEHDEADLAGVALIFRLFEQELQSDMIPLLVRTPNGRNQIGIKRDCWVLNPKITYSSRQDWMKCYQLIGSIIARFGLDYGTSLSEYFCPQKHACQVIHSANGHSCDLCRESMGSQPESNAPCGFFRCQQCDFDACRKCVPDSKGIGKFYVAFAPTFWMLLLGDQPTLENFAREDSQLEKRLNMLEKSHAVGGNAWPDEKWSFTDYHGEEQAVDFQDPALQKDAEANNATRHRKTDQLTHEDYEDFKIKLASKLREQTAEQMKYVKMGLKHTLGENSYMTGFLNWHDMMIISEGSQAKNYENSLEYIKGKVKYVDCDETGENKDYIAMFWKIYTEFNYEDKKSFFNFWFGGSRIGQKSHNLKKEEFRIKLDPEQAANGLPISRPDQLELILPETAYENEEKFREKLLEAMEKGVGLDRLSE